MPRGRRRNRWIGPIESCASLCRLPPEDRQTLLPASSPSSSRKSGASKLSSRTGEAPAPISEMKWPPDPILMATRCCLPRHLAVNRSLYRSLSYDPIADFTAVSLVSRFSLFMFVPNSLPTRSVMEFVAYAKAHPGKLTLASPGTGSTPHLAGELLKQMAGFEMTHVPYRGASPALNDLIPGRVDCYFGSGALLENMRSGQLRGLAVTGAKRDPVAPELPTMAEAGVPGYEVSSWHGLFVPARTPPEIVRKMSVDTIAALADPVVKSKLEQAGYMVVGSSPDELKNSPQIGSR